MDFNETWYIAFPLVDLDLFYGKVEYGYICFSVEKD